MFIVDFTYSVLFSPFYFALKPLNLSFDIATGLNFNVLPLTSKMLVDKIQLIFLIRRRVL